uniref:PH domain-containing protein n=1 Tax=Heterorhabditis bacteriophora TaxID=37862 RepID=A0A1I7XUU8_HETBA
MLTDNSAQIETGASIVDNITRCIKSCTSFFSKEAVRKTISKQWVSPTVVEETLPPEDKKESTLSLSSCGCENTTHTSCYHYVKKKLDEIINESKEGYRLTESDISEETDSQTTTLSRSHNVVTPILPGHDTPLEIEIAPPVVKAAESLSLVSPNLVLKSQQPTNPFKNCNPNAKSLMTSSYNECYQLEKSKSEMKLGRNKEQEIIGAPIKPVEKNRTISMANRLTKGLHDLTHGSSDRLQKWKIKLQSGGALRRHKDQSEPPITRQMLSNVPVSDDLNVSHKSPRPLHSSKSASDALQVNHITSATNIPLCLNGDLMDHRTLKSRESSVSQKDLSFHYHNMNSLQKIITTIDGYARGNFDYPPPKIMPFSGVKPKLRYYISVRQNHVNENIIRPIAFRPIGTLSDDQRKRHSKPMGLEKQVIRGCLLQKTQENEYDCVPDYSEKEKLSDFGSSGSDYGSIHPVHSLTKTSPFTTSCGATSTGSHLSSPPTTKKLYPSVSSSGRNSSAIQITPSPSDSGIVDFETAIRDKENELKIVRNTMEQNEEIIIKVYQEKEGAWKEELERLKTRLGASEKGENALRAQLSNCQKQTEMMSRSIDALRDEKTGLLRKCFQLERELTQLKQEINRPSTCSECRQRQKLISAPKQIMELELNLRSEVADLREEVTSLKQTLIGQIELFSEERKKWENELFSLISDMDQLRNESGDRRFGGRLSFEQHQRTLSSSSLDPYEDPVYGLERVSSYSDMRNLARRRRRDEERIRSQNRMDVKEEGQSALSSEYESLNYEISENQLYREEEANPKHHMKLWKQSRNRWIACFFIGVFTAFVAAAIDIMVHYSKEIKFGLILNTLLSKCDQESELTGEGCMWMVEGAWITYNCVLVGIAGALVIFWAPIAGGSGIPQIKCFLNGIQIPEVVKLKTLFAKAVGVACSVAGGLSAGKEGPMIHSGAVVGAGISQGRCRSIPFDTGLFKGFRNDREKRDFVSAGAAAGVASAFGAPIGGVLFSLEEGASFWNQNLTWRMVSIFPNHTNFLIMYGYEEIEKTIFQFFSAMISAFTVNLILSWFNGRSGWLSWTGLANFGVFEVWRI